MKKKINEQYSEYSENPDFARMISILLQSRTQIHTLHWQTRSEPEHTALGEYYTGIVDLIDGLVESYQGNYDIVTGYKSYEIVPYESTQNTAQYLKAVYNKVEELRSCCEDSYIQNQIDTIQEFINKTMYKLRFLD